ncbi:unnamed protein product [Dicrocoelium dendriticum]|nr:unnamed protein product [Dicrocoelium dendriticum]
MASQIVDDVSSKSALTQENYEFRRQLEIVRQMEAEYLDEIEQLKHAIETKAEQSVKVHTDPDRSILVQLEDRAQSAERKVIQLQMELCSSQQNLVHVEDKLATAEFRLDTRNLEISSHKSEQDDLDRAALVEEVSRLNEELAHVRAQHQFDVGRLERQLVEAEEDRSGLQGDLADLERHLKEARIELSDARAQLEAVELQSNCAAVTRGNSAFSEVEDRRIRAERLVLQQRQMIEELKLELERVQAESKRRLLSEVQNLEVRYRERDTKFTDNLVAERERLQAENRALTLQLQQLEELQLDANVAP